MQGCHQVTYETPQSLIPDDDDFGPIIISPPHSPGYHPLAHGPGASRDDSEPRTPGGPLSECDEACDRHISSPELVPKPSPKFYSKLTPEPSPEPKSKPAPEPKSKPAPEPKSKPAPRPEPTKEERQRQQIRELKKQLADLEELNSKSWAPKCCTCNAPGYETKLFQIQTVSSAVQLSALKNLNMTAEKGFQKGRLICQPCAKQVEGIKVQTMPDMEELYNKSCPRSEEMQALYNLTGCTDNHHQLLKAVTAVDRTNPKADSDKDRSLVTICWNVFEAQAELQVQLRELAKFRDDVEANSEEARALAQTVFWSHHSYILKRNPVHAKRSSKRKAPADDSSSSSSDEDEDPSDDFKLGQDSKLTAKDCAKPKKKVRVLTSYK